MKTDLKLNFLNNNNDTFKKKNYDIDADFYWKIVLYITFFLLLFGAFFGFYTYLKINKDTNSSKSTSSLQVGKVDKARIEKVLEYFSSRANTSENIMSSPSPIVDPSR